MVAASGGEYDLAGLLRATVDALGAMDREALEALSAEAEEIAKHREKLKAGDLKEAVVLKGALGELLLSTERSLKMLRGLQAGGLRRLEEGVAWDR